MPSPITEQYKQEMGLLDSYLKEIQAEEIAATNRKDTARSDEAMALIHEINTVRRPQLKQKFEELQLKRKGELIEGIASGDLITDKSAPIKSYTPDFDPSGMGSYGSSESFTEVPRKYNPEKTKKYISELFEYPEEKVDVENGLTSRQLSELAVLQTPEKKQFYLQEVLKFPKVQRIVIDGKENFIVEDNSKTEFSKDPKGTLKLVAPNGLQPADVRAFLASETLPMAGNIIGGILGAGSGAVTGPGMAVTTALGAAAGGMAAGTGQDIVASAILGVPPNAGESIKRRGFESAIGIPIDLLTAGAGSKLGLTKVGSKPIVNEVEKNLIEATELLNKQGMKVNYPMGAMTGHAGLAQHQRVVGAFPDSAAAVPFRKNQEEIAKFVKASIDRSPIVDKPASLEILKKELDDTVLNLKVAKESLTEQPQEWVARRTAQLMPNKRSFVDAGTRVSQALTRGKDLLRNAKNAEFDAWASSTKATQTPEELANILRPIVQDSGLGKNPAVEEIMTRLGNAEFDRKAAQELESEIMRADAAGILVPEQARIKLKNLREYSEPFDAIRSRDLIKNLQADIPNTPVGWNKNNDVTRQATEAVRNNFQSKLNSQELAGWDKFKEAYTDYLSFEKGSLGKMVEDNFGDLAIAPEEVISRSIKDTKAVNDTLNALRAAGDVEGEEFTRQAMKDAYLYKLGFNPESGIPVGRAKFDSDMVNAIWGEGGGAARVNATFKELNDSLSKADVEFASLKPQDADKLMSETLSIGERQKLISSITDVAVKQKKMDDLVKNEIIKKAKDGELRFANSHVFTQAMMEGRTSDVLEITNKMTPKMKQDMGADAIAYIFSKYGATNADFAINKGDLAGTLLPNSKKMLEDIGSWQRQAYNSQRNS